jgi:TonB family protein
METFALYLIKSVIWLTGFALVYILFLKNERFFELNRIFLLSGILAALIFPFITVSYKVILPIVSDSQAEKDVVSAVQNTPVSISGPDLGLMIFYLYLAGLLFVAFMIVRQGRSLLRAIKRSGIIPSDPVKLIKTAEYDSAFSFFSYVFVNPSVTEIEMREIMNHEIVHIRQKHWFDLLLVQLLCVLQWFNPVIWIYIRFVRQNHEYIADKVALQRTSDPAIYRAALLNQIVGSQVISLVNSFNYSVNKKRFTMMKNIISSPYRKMKILFILPVLAIVFYAFAKPDYQYVSQTDNPAVQKPVSQASDKIVQGSIVQQNGTPLQGAAIVVVGTTIGTTSDSKGYFKVGNVPEDGAIVVTYVGFKSKVIKPVFTKEMTVKMIADTIVYVNSEPGVPAPPLPPPPPPPPPLNIKDTNGGPPPLVVIDGKVTDINVNAINPETIGSMAVLKDKSATDKYGEKGKNGVIEIVSKKEESLSEVKELPAAKTVKPVTDQKAEDLFVVVEELPEFPGGGSAMISWINQNLKYPEEAYKTKITGKVYVDFLVSSTGKVRNAQVNKSVNPYLDAEAKRVVSSMPEWKPGSQNGKTVDVQMKVPVEFKLK